MSTTPPVAFLLTLSAGEKLGGLLQKSTRLVFRPLVSIQIRYYLTPMYISRFKVTNFKSYRESAPLEFSSGLNLIVGQNNAGKSALLEALSLNPPSNPHRSPLTMMFEGAPPLQRSAIDVSFSITRTELLEMMASLPGTTFILPYPQDGSEFAESIHFVDDSPASHARLAEAFLSPEKYTVQLTRDSAETVNWSGFTSPSFGLYPTAKPGSGWYNRSVQYVYEGAGKLRPIAMPGAPPLVLKGWVLGFSPSSTLEL
jgi:hypothetical protein